MDPDRESADPQPVSAQRLLCRKRNLNVPLPERGQGIPDLGRVWFADDRLDRVAKSHCHAGNRNLGIHAD